MAIDDKFVTAGISNDVITNMNRSRRKKRKRPKPWDPPSKVEEKSEKNEILAENSEASESPLLKDNIHPTEDPKSKIKSHTEDSDLNLEDLASHSAQYSDKSKETVRGQSEDKKETVRGQSVDSTKTVERQSEDSKDTDRGQCEDTKETVRVQSVDSAKTVERQSEDSKDTDRGQCEDSKETVRVQSVDSAGTVERQSEDSEDTDRGQCEDTKETVRVQSGDKQETKRRQKSDRKGTESRQYDPISGDSKETLELDLFASILSFEHAESLYFSLSGNRLKLIDWLAKKCIDTGSTFVKQITHQQVAEMSGITNYSTYKKILQRLKSSDLLEVKSYQRGPGARVDIHLQKAVISVYAKHGKVRGQYGDSKGTYMETNSSSSSSSLNNNIETTTKKKVSLPEEWMEIQIPESLKKIRFGIPQLKQIYNKEENELTPSEVQESLDNMAYDIESGTAEEKNFKSPLHILMKVLINGQPYFSEALIKASEDALKRQEDLYERYKQAQKDEAEKKLSEKFEEYFKTLTQADINKIVPPNNIAKEGSTSQKMILRQKYREENGI